ncbi:MAG: response regulator transcription factor [Dehalococcoidales bacterium]|nr:response regulator transcription factor [Dehalococcoidales bacterium]
MERITVLLVDELPVIREGLRIMLQIAADIEVVDEASDGLEALQKVAEHHPVVVLTELRSRCVDGLGILRRIKDEFPETSVIVLSTFDHSSFVLEALLAGSSGFLHKDASRELFIHSIRTVTSGGIVLATSLRGALSSAFRPSSDFAGNGNADKEDLKWAINKELTPREREVLMLLVDGYTNKQIAQALSVSEETAKKHVHRIISKLGAIDRTQAAVKAIRAGLAY